MSLLGPIDCVLLTDTNEGRVREFSRRVAQSHPGLTINTATIDAVLQESDLLSIATTATQPFIHALPRRAVTVLLISLRDLAPEVILDAVNIVDDAEHVCSERTSIHLAAQAVGHTQFIHSTIPDLLLDRAKPLPAGAPVVVSPFGLSILDLALARFVLTRARSIDNDCVFVPDFVGTSWNTGEASHDR
jgi:ornithine cyclodeaminase/alanine dehydrogenase-like protein (mu-crystallin family)